MKKLGPFGKFYAKTFEGSMFGIGPDVFAIWGYCIANATPPDGTVTLNARKLAAVIGMSEERAEAAIETLCSPDPDSDSPAEDGRRLIRIGQFLYRLTNFDDYRNGRDPVVRREQNREASKRFRDKKKQENESDEATVSQRQPPSASVSQRQPKSAQAEAEAEAEAEKKTPCSPPSGDGGLEAMRLRVGGWFNRRPTTKWSDKEVKALKAVLAMKTPADDLNVLEAYYQSGYQYLRRDPLTLLNNWPGEIDRAKQWKVNPGLPMSAGKTSSEPRTFNDQMALFIRNQQLKANVQS